VAVIHSVDSQSTTFHPLHNLERLSCANVRSVRRQYFYWRPLTLIFTESTLFSNHPYLSQHFIMRVTLAAD